MLRLFSAFGLGILFLWISPVLRNQTNGAIGMGVATMSRYAPWSYMLGGVLLIISMMMAFKSGAAPR
ncbi:MAG: hypothetical protein ABI972_22530 [Acidobacteriota bacterium]